MNCTCGNKYAYLYDTECISCKALPPVTPCFVCNNSLPGERTRRTIRDEYATITVTVCRACNLLDDESVIYMLNLSHTN